MSTLGRRAIAISAILFYLYLSFYPFRWNPPRKVKNHARATKEHSLQFDEPGIAMSSAEWVNDAIQRQEFTIDLRLRSFASEQQSGVIFTCSRDMSRCNIRIRQEDSDLVVRIRTRQSALGAVDVVRIPQFFARTHQWRHIRIVVVARTLHVVTNGETVSEQLEDQPLSNWNGSYDVALGNEPTGNWPWLGEIETANVAVGEKVIDYLAANDLDIPASYWVVYMQPRLVPFVEFDHDGWNQDYVINLLGYIPLGFLLALVWTGKHRVRTAILLCILISSVAEVGQLCFLGRFPSTTDFVLNTSGGAIGVGVAKLFEVSFLRLRDGLVGQRHVSREHRNSRVQEDD